jgi:RND family efflux transporter MFP subunit
VAAVPDRIVQNVPAAPVAPVGGPPGAPALGPVATVPPAIAPGPRGFIGVISAQTVELKSLVDGRLVEIKAQDGQAVKKGDPLFRFDNSAVQAELKVAGARLDLAKSKLQRSQQLGEQNLSSKSDLEEAKAAVMIEQALVAAKEREYESYIIAAPFDGILTTCEVSENQNLLKGTRLTRIINISAIRADFSLPQDMASSVSVGGKVTVHASDISATGEISYVSPIADQGSGTFGVRAKLTDAPSSLKPGMVINVEVEGKNPR